MSRFAIATFVSVLLGLASPASAHERLYPLTRCGPDLAYFCRLHGHFDMVPFHYQTAIYPGCIRPVWIQTPYGTERSLQIVCGAPARSMIWW